MTVHDIMSRKGNPNQLGEIYKHVPRWSSNVTMDESYDVDTTVITKEKSKKFMKLLFFKKRCALLCKAWLVNNNVD
jgi:hypothetical protein